MNRYEEIWKKLKAEVIRNKERSGRLVEESNGYYMTRGTYALKNAYNRELAMFTDMLDCMETLEKKYVKGN